MKVAVSGTHCSGKSTLIDHFLLAHPDFAHEPEPYTALQDDYGELFAEQPSADDFYRQLEFNIQRLHHYRPSRKVIYERSPIDFLAYLLALDDLRRDNQAALLAEESVGMVKEAVKLLDLILFLPLNDVRDNVTPDREDQELRIAVDDRLVGILIEDEFGDLTSLGPRILEARGTTKQRLEILESVLETQLKEREE